MLSIGGAETNENYTLNEKLTKKDDEREDRMKKIAFFPDQKQLTTTYPLSHWYCFFFQKIICFYEKFTCLEWSNML